MQCPFCKEEIKEDAIKCKHCHSFLYKMEQPEEKKEGSKYLTYVLDKDLVRFGKFALSILAIFITVGIILYGVDLKGICYLLSCKIPNLFHYFTL